jgi:hypothetical protein
MGSRETTQARNAATNSQRIHQDSINYGSVNKEGEGIERSGCGSQDCRSGGGSKGCRSSQCLTRF